MMRPMTHGGVHEEELGLCSPQQNRATGSSSAGVEISAGGSNSACRVFLPFLGPG